MCRLKMTGDRLAMDDAFKSNVNAGNLCSPILLFMKCADESFGFE